MKLNEREQWILAEGSWIGVGVSFIALCVVIYLNIPIESNTWYWGIILGLIFILLGLYCKKQIKQEETK